MPGNYASPVRIRLPLPPSAYSAFELDGAGRYRDGWHWAHWLNPAWHVLPAVQHVLVKPYRHRKLAPRQFSAA